MSKKNLIEIEPEVFLNDLDYYPLYEELRPSTMGLNKLPKYNNDRDKIFQFGDSFKALRKNKLDERNQKIEKYYQRLGEPPKSILRFIINKLITEYPELFQIEDLKNGTKKLSCLKTRESLVFRQLSLTSSLENPPSVVDLLDGLAMQVSEDLVIHKIQEQSDMASHIHLFHPNGWSAEGTIGKSFDFIHHDVEGIKSIVPNTKNMMNRILEEDFSFERIAAINFKTNKIFNRHPDFSKYYEKPFDLTNPQLFIRVERQTVTGFPKESAFLFTIRTYFYDLNPEVIGKDRTKILYETFLNPKQKVYSYKFIKDNREKILKWLDSSL
jgi:dimethylamine monooxygenase subunit A